MKKPLIVLAPLAGYTNIAYRKMMKRFGCDLVVSEMISDYALHYQNRETFAMVATCPEERPVGIQLFGGSKDSLLKGLERLERIASYDVLDLNLGCPVQKVVKNGSGSAWLLNERREELFDTVSALVEASSRPVTCKIRLGWDRDSINVVETCKILERAGVQMIVIHGRTRSQLYSGKSDYLWIKKAKESVSIPIVANGDIQTLEQAVSVLNFTGCDGIAIGRGCLGNPRLIEQIHTYFETGIKLPEATFQEQTVYLKEHYAALKELKGDFTATCEMRGIASWYLKGFSNVRKYKAEFSKIQTEKDFEDIVSRMEKDPEIRRVSS